ncbi:MAG TPA: DinB family protein [candidate division Zixibacteria bacterium]|nr:DinB family protein [candidate division Zixibacteria bacterium]
MRDGFHRELIAALDGSQGHPPPLTVLEGLSLREARSRPLRRVPSIYEILAHMNYWQSLLLNFLENAGDKLRYDADASWPPIPQRVTEPDWTALVDQFESGLYRAIGVSQARDLNTRVNPTEEHTYGTVLLMLAEHNAYHCGQIVTIRQVLDRWPPEGQDIPEPTEGHLTTPSDDDLATANHRTQEQPASA